MQRQDPTRGVSGALRPPGRRFLERRAPVSAARESDKEDANSRRARGRQSSRSHSVPRSRRALRGLETPTGDEPVTYRVCHRGQCQADFRAPSRAGLAGPTIDSWPPTARPERQRARARTHARAGSCRAFGSSTSPRSRRPRVRGRSRGPAPEAPKAAGCARSTASPWAGAAASAEEETVAATASVSRSGSQSDSRPADELTVRRYDRRVLA